MASLTHGLLTEDEAVLLGALSPGPGDRVLAVFARGNGDAGLSLLQGGPVEVLVHDLFDPVSLAAQLELKRWLFAQLDAAALRGFLGIGEPYDATERDRVIARAMHEVSPGCRSFWSERRAALRGGVARCDSTAAWERTLGRFLRASERMPRAVRFACVRAGRLVAPLYFPREEREYSLGYRQLLARPDEMLERFTQRLNEAGELRLIPYAKFRYLAAEGHATIREHLSRLRMVDALTTANRSNRIYFSNVIDYLSKTEFLRLVGRAAPIGRGPWRALVNTTYASDRLHPYLEAGVQRGMLRIDHDETARLRLQDRVGVYPGLTILTSA